MDDRPTGGENQDEALGWLVLSQAGSKAKLASFDA
jgi:hypothetical protein